MRERYWFRVWTDRVVDIVPPSLGDEKVRGVKDVRIERQSPLFAELAKRNQSTHAGILTAWGVKRSYTRSEIEAAKFFWLRVKRHVGAFGEDYGTTYDDSRACVRCGGRAVRVGRLRLPCRVLPKRADVAVSLAGELVTSVKFEHIWSAAGLTGLSFQDIEAPSGEACSSHRSPIFVGAPADISSVTDIRDNPLARLGVICPTCNREDVLGMAVVSHLTLKRTDALHNDAVATRQLVGLRQGSIRPTPLYIISRRAHSVLTDAGLVGADFEVAAIE